MKIYETGIVHHLNALCAGVQVENQFSPRIGYKKRKGFTYMKIFLRLMHFEMKKIWLKMYVLIVGLCLSACFIFYLSECFNIEDYKSNGEIKLYTGIEGRLTEDKYNFLLKEKEAVKNYIPDNDEEEITDEQAVQRGKYMPTRMADAIVINNAISNCDLILQNEKNRKIIMDLAYRNIHELENSNLRDKSYKLRFNQKIIKTYKKQPQIYILSPESKSAWNVYFMINIHTVLIMIFLILVITPLFVQEKETGMQSLLETYERGKTMLFFSKIMATILTTIFIVVYFEVLQFICLKIFLPEIGGLNYPIQTVMSECPFDLSIAQFILIKAGCIIIASLMISMCILMFSIIFSRKIICLGASFLFILITYGVVFYEKIWRIEIMRNDVLPHVEEKLSGLKTYIFTYLFSPVDYFSKFECVNICGYPMFPLCVVIVGTVILIVLLIPITYIMYVKKRK